jgi:hypothetical protein
VAGRENQRVEAARLDDAPVAVVDDLVREHAVLEGPVGELEGDQVAASRRSMWRKVAPKVVRWPAMAVTPSKLDRGEVSVA